MARAKKTVSNNQTTKSEYEDPDTGQETEQDFDDVGEDVEMFDAPEADDTAQSLDEEAAQDEAALSSADNDVLAAKAEVEHQLCARVEACAASASAFDVDAGDMIQGVGVGTPEFDMEQTSHEGPGASVLNIYTSERLSMEETRRSLFDDFSVQSVADDGFPVNVHHTGIIDSQPHRHRARPSPCGISVGHFRITAGTQGALSRGRRAPRRNRLLMLSNNHVLANSNNARFGDNILQPGRADGGRNPQDRIAILERFVPINFGGRPNLVDAATGWCWPERVRKEFLYRSGGRWRHFRVASTPVGCRRGMIVGKSGRTTQLTSGRITGCGETIRVRYGARVAVFRDQIAVRGLRGQFSAGGDSGSLIWTWNSRRNPVGLLFAGGGNFTFGNKIGHVLAALDISLVT